MTTDSDEFVTDDEQSPRSGSLDPNAFHHYVLKTEEWRTETARRLDCLSRNITDVKQVLDTHIVPSAEVLRELRERKELVGKLKHSVIGNSLTGTVWAVIGFVGVSVYEYIKMKLK